MKPISVRFKCFGPYVEEQFIDFQDLRKSGLFLICGETGAGKTTILDAICYALYGQSSGGSRGSLQDMRCKKAAEGEDTFVDYIFSSGEETYRFYRCLKPRKQRKSSQEAGRAQTFHEEFQCHILRDGEFVPLSDTKATQTYINAMAVKILGLEYAQFKQVIILPQGQFEKLLTSNSDDKEKILVSLFHAEKYEKVSKLLLDRLSEEEKALKLQKALLDQKLLSLGCRNLEELGALADRTGQQCSELLEQYRGLETEIQGRKAALDQAKKDDQGFCALEEAERRLAVLSRQQPGIREDQKRLDRAKAAETVTPAYREYQQAGLNARKAEKTRLEREGMLAAARRRTEKLQQEQLAHEEHRPACEEQKRKKILLESLKDLYQSLDAKERSCRQAERAEHMAHMDLQEAEKGLEYGNRILQQSVEAQKKAELAFHRGQSIYLGNIGGILAEKLQEGEKCPVCGSCHHPEPARPVGERISEDELELLNRASRKAMKELEDATAGREKAAERKQQAELRFTACRKEAESVRRSYGEALSQREAGIETERQRVEVLRALTEVIQAFENADRSMQDRINAADSDLRTQQQRREDAVRDAGLTAEAFRQAEKTWITLSAGAGFADEQAYQASCMEAPARQALQEKVIRFETDLKNAEQELQEKKAALGDRVRPDVAGANAALNQAEKRKEEISNLHGLKKQALQDQQKVLQLLQKELPLWDQKDQKNKANMEFARLLRGDNSVSLQRYVLGVMLTSITHEANRLLKTVYGGRYQLYRTNETSGNVRKKGLELAVADQDGLRNVNTLSGGEKFLLSLSLGIGLATVVQAQGNGIRLEAMFIDEGFGSLDEKSIDDAMEILETVRSGSGIVGIISHVERLAETIPAKIQITKTKNGSRCRVCC